MIRLQTDDGDVREFAGPSVTLGGPEEDVTLGDGRSGPRVRVRKVAGMWLADSTGGPITVGGKAASTHWLSPGDALEANGHRVRFLGETAAPAAVAPAPAPRPAASPATGASPATAAADPDGDRPEGRWLFVAIGVVAGTVLAALLVFALWPRGAGVPDAEPGPVADTAGPGLGTAAAPVPAAVPAVWVGIVLDGTRLPVCSAVPVGPRRVATAAAAAAFLGRSLTGSQPGEPRAFGGDLPPGGVPVTAVAAHPRFDSADPGGARSVAAGVAVLTLAAPLAPPHAVPAPPDAELTAGAAVTVRGFGLPMELRAADPLDPPRPFAFAAAVAGSDRAFAREPGFPVFVLDRRPPDGAAGAGVYDGRGRLIGVTAPLTDGPAAVIPADRLSALLTADR